ncbi:MAG: DUF4157 domain-containing protein [bacterium]
MDSPRQAADHGTRGGATALPHLDRIQASFGRHDVSGVDAHEGPEAAESASALGAKAFASGNSVVFGVSPDLHTAAHEAAHVVQQRSGVQLKGGMDEPGDAYEQHADAVADAVVAGQSAEALLDEAPSGGSARPVIQREVLVRDGSRTGATGPSNPDYINKYASRIISAIAARIQSVGLPTPHPRLYWFEKAASVEAVANAIAKYVEAAPSLTLKRLMMLSYPANLLEIVDGARRGPDGTRQRGVEIAVAAAFDEPLIASIARMGMRTVVQLDQHHAERLRASQIVASCPLDGVIAEVLTTPGTVMHVPKKAGGADDTRGKPFAKGARDVKFEWLGVKDRKLWNWIHVTSPVNATAEDVAQTPLTAEDDIEDSNRAYRLAVSPPYFGIPFELAKEVPQARKYAPEHLDLKLDTGPGPRVADPDVVAVSPVADEIVIAQAPKPSRDDLPVADAVERASIQLSFLKVKLAPWHVKIPAGAEQFLARRKSETSGDRKAAQQFAAVLTQQIGVLHDAGSDLVQVLAEVTAGQVTPENLGQVPSIREVVTAFARVAGVSHLPIAARAALAEARRERTMLPLALAEERMRAARGAVNEQRSTETGSDNDKPDPRATATIADVTTQMDEAARLRLAAARGQKLDADAVDTLTVDASETELRARLITLVNTATALMNKADSVGLPKDTHPSGAWSVHQVCELILKKVNGAVPKAGAIANDPTGGGWQERLDAARKPAGTVKEQLKKRRDAIAAVTRDTQNFATTLGANEFFKDAQAQIKDQEMYNLIKSIALQIGIAVISGQAVGAIGAALRGISLAGTIGAEIRNASLLYKGALIIGEATANTGVNAAMGGKFGARELAENALGIILTSAALKPFHGLLEDSVAVEKQIRTWGQLAKAGGKAAAELVIDTGVGIGAAGVAHAVTHGGELSQHDAMEWVTQGLSIAASKFVQSGTVQMHERITRAAAELKSPEFKKLQGEVAVLHDHAASRQDPKRPATPEEAIGMLKERRRLLLAEHDLLVHDPRAKQALATNEADLAATGSKFADVPLQLSHVTPLVDGHVYEGTSKQIHDAFAAADAMGVPMRREWVPEQKMWRVTSGERVIEVHEHSAAKQPHESRAAASAVPDSGFTGRTPAGEVRNPFTIKQVHVGAEQAAMILNRGSKNAFHAQPDGSVMIGNVKVTFAIGIPEANGNVAAHTYVAGATDVTVTISSQARGQDLTRAVAHELAEIHAMVKDPTLPRGGKLKPGTAETSLGAHDIGRKAELEVLIDELTTQPGRSADVMHELTKLIEVLGFDMKTVTTDARARKVLGKYVVDAIAVHTSLGPLKARTSHWARDAQMGLARLRQSNGPDEIRLTQKIVDNIDMPGMESLAKLASRQVGNREQLSDLEFGIDTAIKLRRSGASVAVENNYYDGKPVTIDELARVRKSPGFDDKKHVNIDVETTSERREMKRVTEDVHTADRFNGQIKEGVGKFLRSGLQSRKAGGPKSNIIEVAYADKIKKGWSESEMRRIASEYLAAVPGLSNRLDRLIIHVEIAGHASEFVIEM